MSWFSTPLLSLFSLSSSGQSDWHAKASLELSRRLATCAIAGLGAIFAIFFGGDGHTAAAFAGLFATVTGYWLLVMPFDPLPPDFDLEVFAVTTTMAIGLQTSVDAFWHYVSLWMLFVIYAFLSLSSLANPRTI